MSKVTLKIGDKFSIKVGIDAFITGFTDNKVNTTKGSWSVPFRCDYYYVNGVKYSADGEVIHTIIACKKCGKQIWGDGNS